MKTALEPHSTRTFAIATILFFLAAFVGGHAAWPEKGPYLIYEGQPSEMVVLWQTRETEHCTISWGEDERFLHGSRTCHEYSEHLYRETLTGLTPNTLYMYRITYGDSESVSSFRSASTDDSTDLRFLAWTDTQWVDNNAVGRPGTGSCMYSSMAATLRDELRSDPALQTFVLHGGDWVGGPTEEVWRAFFRKTSARSLLSQVPMLGCIGNHDVGYTFTGDTFTKYWPYPFVEDHYWSFDCGPAHFVILDQYTDAFLATGTDDAQIEWLADDLRTHDRTWTIAVFHNPLCESGSPDCEEAYRALFPTLQEGNVDVLYAGHWHSYHAFELGGIMQIIGGTASTNEAGADLVYSVFDISGDLMRIETKHQNGDVVDIVEVHH